MFSVMDISFAIASGNSVSVVLKLERSDFVVRNSSNNAYEIILGDSRHKNFLP